MNPDQQTDLYKPGDNPISGEPGASSELGQSPAPAAKFNVSWSAPEFIHHDRGFGWYLLLIAGTAVLAAGVYFLTKDVFATGTIGVLGVIVAFFGTKKPNVAAYELTDSGMRVGEKLYSYSLFKSFALIREGAISSVNFVPIKRFMPPVSAYFDPKDEQKIVDALGEHLPYEERGLDSIDRISRRLRF